MKVGHSKPEKGLTSSEFFKFLFVFDNIPNVLYIRRFIINRINVISLQMNFELCRLANKKGPDEEEFTKLAASLDEFISCLLDPLKTGGRIRDVFLRASIDDVMDAAIEFKQMKVSACH